MPEQTVVQTIPNWYFALSSFLLIFIALLFAVLCALVIALIKAVRQLEPKVSGLITKVNDDLVPQVQGLVGKVDVLTDKVSSIADNAKTISDSARTTVVSVGGKAQAMSNALETFSANGLAKVQHLAPYVGILLTGLKVWQGIAGIRAAQHAEKPKPKK